MNQTPISTADAIVAIASAADWWIVWLTGIGVFATLVIALFTFRANVKADHAQVDATRAWTLAVEATRHSSAKQVETLEVLVERLNSAPTAPPAEDPRTVPPVQWSLESDGKNRWLLRNVGYETARDAILRPLTESDAQDLYIPIEKPMDVAPQMTLPFSISRTFASAPATVVDVGWLDGTRYGQSMAFVVR